MGNSKDYKGKSLESQCEASILMGSGKSNSGK